MKKLFSKKLTIYIVSIIFVLSLGLISTKLVANAQTDNSLVNRLSGRILLQVEDNGEAWYLDPNNNLRYYLGRPADAFNIMRSLGLGASNKDITSFLKSKAPSRLAGRILIQVEDKGQAYYVNPIDLKLYYLGRPADAFNVMRNLGLGITNSNLNKIAKHEGQANNNTETIPKENTEIKVITQKPALMTNFTHIISLSASISKIDNIKEKGFLYKYTSDLNEELSPTLNDYEQKIIDSSNNTNSIKIDLSNLKPETYPHIRAYVIDSNNNIIYGNIETIDSVGKKGTPAMPISNSGSTAQAPDEEGEEGEGDGEDGSGDEEEGPEVIQYTLTYTASEGGYVKLNDYPEWNEGLNLPFALSGSAHLPITDTKIFIAGGITGDMLATSTVLIYDTELMQYEYLSPMNEARVLPAITKKGDKIYVAKGLELFLGTQSHSIEVYDLNTGQWEYIANSNYQGQAFHIANYNNEIYLFGDFDGNNTPLNYIEKYDISNNQWEIISTSTRTEQVKARKAKLIEDSIYFIDTILTQNPFSVSNKFYSYNFIEGVYNFNLPEIPNINFFGNLVYLNNKFLYFGGMDILSYEFTDHVYEYSFAENEWRRVFNMPHGLIMSNIENIGDYVYIIGGMNDVGSVYDVNYKIESEKLSFVENEVQQIVFTGDEAVEVYAIPENGYEFTMWSDQYGNYVRKDDIAALTEENVILTAFFEPYTPEFNDPDNDLVLVFSVDAGETLTLPVKDGLATPYGKDGYNFIVNWGDGTTSIVTSFDDEDIRHTYTEAATTTVRIAGKYPRIFFNNNENGNKDNLLEVFQWGDVGFISFQNSFRGCSNLISLPDGPITGAERVINYSRAFQDSSLTSISSDLFNLTPKAVNFSNTFSASLLSSIPSGLFDNTPNAIYFDNIFRDNNISSIPSGLFDNTPNAIYFDDAFSYNNITDIPAHLFSSTSNITSMINTFYDNRITSIPENLFANNPLVTDFSFTFYNNRITSIPENLFANNPLVTDFSFTFYNNRITSIPENLFANTPDVTSFISVFNNNSTLTGLAPELWLRTNPTPIGAGAFSGATNLENWLSIPSNWK